MRDKWLRDRLVNSIHEDEEVLEPVENEPAEDNTEEETSTSNPVLEAATAVMASYQTANKWLDSIKEFLLMDLGCVFFSNYIHELAHTMPERFDQFGDILHSINMKVPYPATAEIQTMPKDLSSTFDQVISLLATIRASLKNFNKVIQETEEDHLSIQVDELILDIGEEFPDLYRMQKVCNSCDTITFDKWVAVYIMHKDTLVD